MHNKAGSWIVLSSKATQKVHFSLESKARDRVVMEIYDDEQKLIDIGETHVLEMSAGEIYYVRIYTIRTGENGVDQFSLAVKADQPDTAEGAIVKLLGGKSFVCSDNIFGTKVCESFCVFNYSVKGRSDGRTLFVLGILTTIKSAQAGSYALYPIP